MIRPLPGERRAGRPTAAELLFAALVLTGVGVLAYGSYVLHAGFYSDDWANAADEQRAGYWTNVGNLQKVLGGRPLLALLLPLPHVLFGVHPALHLALALALGIATSLCLFLLLRTLSMPVPHATAIAVLALLFPWSDAMRLWATASLNNLSVCCFLLGVVVALRGLPSRGARGVAVHAGALALYLASVLTYEVAAAAITLTGLLYLGRAPRGSAVRRWLADIVVVAGALSYSLAATVRTRHVGSLAERIHDLRPFARESLSLLASSLVPVQTSSWVVKGLILLPVILTAVLSVARRAQRRSLPYWPAMAGAAGVAVAAAYFMFLGSHLHPGDVGIDSRINVFAGPAYCVLAYALVMTPVQLVLGHARRAAAIGLAGATAIAIGYGIVLHDDETAWRRASTLQHQLLRKLKAELPALRPHTTLLSFGFPAQTSTGVPVFDRSWDLNGAVQLQARDFTLSAYPIFEGVQVRCAGRDVVVAGAGSYGTFTVRYGNALFFDGRAGEADAIGSRRACLGGRRRFLPGPLLTPAD